MNISSFDSLFEEFDSKEKLPSFATPKQSFMKLVGSFVSRYDSDSDDESVVSNTSFGTLSIASTPLFSSISLKRTSSKSSTTSRQELPTITAATTLAEDPERPLSMDIQQSMHKIATKASFLFPTISKKKSLKANQVTFDEHDLPPRSDSRTAIDLPRIPSRTSLDMTRSASRTSIDLNRMTSRTSLDLPRMNSFTNLDLKRASRTSLDSRGSALDLIPEREQLTIFPKFHPISPRESRLIIYPDDLTLSSRADSIPIQFYKNLLYVNVDYAQTLKRYTLYTIRVQKLPLNEIHLITKRYSDIKCFYLNLKLDHLKEMEHCPTFPPSKPLTRFDQETVMDRIVEFNKILRYIVLDDVLVKTAKVAEFFEL